ncbi:MAG: site-2 protease family protein [Planctomycetaceae bacterium]
MDLLTMTLAATTFTEKLAGWSTNGVSFVAAAIGLGMVIFFHELGHFAVAKWCNVNVERFSIGFGPVLLSWKWGETEYALSLIPFGGYVKMLGQDDADPSQLTNEEIAQDPRSYLAKNVWQRMAIISAGVTMNIITAVFFVGGAYMIGHETFPNIIGEVRPGMPAWKAGLQPDDVIERINGRRILTFEDVRLNVALSDPPLQIEGRHHDGSPLSLTILPEQTQTSSHPQIGVLNTRSLKVGKPTPKFSFVFPGSVAETAEPPFQAGDLIETVNGETVKTFWELRKTLARQEEGTLKLGVTRADGSKETIVLKNNSFRTLGLSMDAGRVAALQKGSPAETAGLQEGDKLVKVDGKDIGKEIDPLKLPNLFASLHGKDVEVTVARQPKDGAPETVNLTIRPTDLPGWIDQPNYEGESISIPSIGASFHTIPVVLAVEPGSPAAEEGITVKEGGAIIKLKSVELFIPPDAVKGETKKRDPLVINLDDPKIAAKSNNWAHAFWAMQEFPNCKVRLTLVEDQKERKVELTPKPDPTWPLPVIQGLRMEQLEMEQKAKNLGEAWMMSTNYTRNSAMNIYLTLRSLFTGRVSPKELHGPIGIATAAVTIVQHGLSPLLLFLGFLSINLAVLNFLPIPVLDGGHMVFLTWEAVTGHRPSERIMIGATYVGMFFLLSLMAFVLYLDVFVHPFR